jgi:energy-coupling factor transporter ATP-binding protein EcfA2
MIISRVQVEGGFLDGLDVCFEQGLNAVIGARGTGKSSLIELLRVGLGASNKTPESELKTDAHVRAVLKDGEVIVTFEHDGDEFISRYSVGSDSGLHDANVNPNIFSQSEIENIGLLSNGRRELIDAFDFELGQLDGAENILIAKIDEKSVDILRLNSALLLNEAGVAPIKKLESELGLLMVEEKKVLGESDSLKAKSDEIQNLGNQHRLLGGQSTETQNFITSVTKFVLEVTQKIATDLAIGPESHIRKNSNILNQYQASIARIKQGLDGLVGASASSQAIVQETKVSLEEVSAVGRRLRIEIDQMKTGMGEVTRKAQKLRNQLVLANDALRNTENIRSQIVLLRSERDVFLSELEHGRSLRSQKRTDIANILSEDLGPDIKISIEQAADTGKYLDTILSCLQGSSLQYREIAPVIADEILPRALIDIVEDNKFTELATLLEITTDRASRLIGALKGESVRELAKVILDDQVKFQLLDGSVYKDFRHLSTGQRCSVILPIILQQKDSLVVIDQPEDHIDNAYISKTLISSILSRSDVGQLVVTTHNANIPVLGNAAMVLHLESDGRRGYSEATGAINDEQIIQSITNVMEGGKEAFDKRAKFYNLIGLEEE